jgi:hypothetical protein
MDFDAILSRGLSHRAGTSDPRISIGASLIYIIAAWQAGGLGDKERPGEQKWFYIILYGQK